MNKIDSIIQEIFNKKTKNPSLAIKSLKVYADLMSKGEIKPQDMKRAGEEMKKEIADLEAHIKSGNIKV
jgi:hypothetical protein